MPKLRGLIDYFPNIEQINSNNLLISLGKKVDSRIVDNSLGNLILYSQIVPETSEDFKFHLAVISQALRVDIKEFYQVASKRIIIPEDFFTFIPNSYQLVSLFINAIKPISINQLAVKSNNDGLKVLGTYIKPNITSQKGVINLSVDGKKYQVEVGKTLTIPIVSRKVDIHFESNAATLFEKNSFSAEISGGLVGIILDASLEK